jgi:hypothetical protein
VILPAFKAALRILRNFAQLCSTVQKADLTAYSSIAILRYTAAESAILQIE